MEDRTFKRALELSKNIECCVKMSRMIQESKIKNFETYIAYNGFNSVEMTDEVRDVVLKTILHKISEYNDEYKAL